jgi:hypothetical protein
MKKPDRISVFKNSLTTELILTLVIGFCSIGIAADQDRETTPALDPVPASLKEYHDVALPILENYCYDCHGDGSSKGGVALDELTTPQHILENPTFWLKVLRNMRSQIMPPSGKPEPKMEEMLALENWIKTAAFGLDPEHPDPGRVTVRHLNRTEYRNTIRDLLGVDIDVDVALLPDDVGYGFDNIGDVLSISPIRMERFVEAAIDVVKRGVPTENIAMSSLLVVGDEYLNTDGSDNAARMSFYRPDVYSHTYHISEPGEYRLILNTKIDGEARPVDPQVARVIWSVDGKPIMEKEHPWADMEYLTDTFNFDWEAGEHEVSVSIAPVFPELKPLRTKMEYRLLWVTLDGPLDPDQWGHPPNYERFFTRDKAPDDTIGRRAYAREILSDFAPKAYRRPVPEETIDDLVQLAETTYSVPGTTFEKGVAQAMVALLASPSFLFHVETAEPPAPGAGYARVDEYTLASRLSYALWASMPDTELMDLAGKGELRNNFRSQVDRMLADPKARAFAANFAGQWLQSRGVLDVPINSEVVMKSEKDPSKEVEEEEAPPVFRPGSPNNGAPPNFGNNNRPPGQNPRPDNLAQNNGPPPRFNRPPGFGFGRRFRRPLPTPGTELTPEIRDAMKQETEAYFNYIVQEDRSILELLDSQYTFVNEHLAPVYGLTNVVGTSMQKVDLPNTSVRGGVITMGSVLTVTSNPTRTSPVKRGKWVLENILGAPPAPPPPNVPALEDAKVDGEQKALTQRELLALHREDPMCASCHERMDPPGLALENFNAFGRFRETEFGQPIEAFGELSTGEEFSGVRDLKRALVENHRVEFYRTITEKLMTYVLGRGIEYYDVPTIDQIVARLDRENGRFSALLLGVLESAPFQLRRTTPHPRTGKTEDVALLNSEDNNL